MTGLEKQQTRMMLKAMRSVYACPIKNMGQYEDAIRKRETLCGVVSELKRGDADIATDILFLVTVINSFIQDYEDEQENG